MPSMIHFKKDSELDICYLIHIDYALRWNTVTVVCYFCLLCSVTQRRVSTTLNVIFTSSVGYCPIWTVPWCGMNIEVYGTTLSWQCNCVAPYVQYIPRNMHTVFALLCFVVVIHWLIFPYPSGLLHWHCGNLSIAAMPAKQPWWLWINTSCEFIMNDCITTTKQSTTKPCAYFLGYTVCGFGLLDDIQPLWWGNTSCEYAFFLTKLAQWNIFSSASLFIPCQNLSARRGLNRNRLCGICIFHCFYDEDIRLVFYFIRYTENYHDMNVNLHMISFPCNSNLVHPL